MQVYIVEALSNKGVWLRWTVLAPDKEQAANAIENEANAGDFKHHTIAVYDHASQTVIITTPPEEQAKEVEQEEDQMETVGL